MQTKEYQMSAFLYNVYKCHRPEFEQQTLQLNSIPNMPFLSASDWFQLLINIHDKVKNLCQTKQLLGEWGRVKMTSVVEVLLIHNLGIR